MVEVDRGVQAERGEPADHGDAMAVSGPAQGGRRADRIELFAARLPQHPPVAIDHRHQCTANHTFGVGISSSRVTCRSVRK
mgnify:CR=1 FL=1